MLCQLPHTYTLLSYIGQYLEYLPVVCHHEVKREKRSANSLLTDLLYMFELLIRPM